MTLAQETSSKMDMQNMLSVFKKLVDDLLSDEVSNPVSEHLPVDKLEEKLKLKLTNEGVSNEQFEKDLRDLVLATPKTSSKAFFNQLFGGRMPQAVLGDLLSVVLNNSMYTYKAAGAQVEAEKEIVKHLLTKLDWSKGNGTFVAGGSLANFKGMLMARDAICPNVKTKGVNQRMRVYTSIESHYSISKNASFAGVGRENVVKINSDKFGKMDMADLSSKISEDKQQGYVPIMINCTAGTTVLGAFDDIAEASKIAKKNNIWLHVDGAYCGAVILSEKYKHLINGVEQADSFCFNAHKMLGTPLSCSIFLAQDEKNLYDTFSNDAEYLYQTDEDSYNLGKISLQCGRRNDALKLWTLWKSIGTNGLEALVDRQFYLAEYARSYINNNPNYTSYGFSNSVSVCFNYKDISANELCTALYEKEISLVGFGQFKGEEFVRMVTVNTNLDEASIDAFFRDLESFAAQGVN